jgi:ferredoxin, 2Fe-2S
MTAALSLRKSALFLKSGVNRQETGVICHSPGRAALGQTGPFPLADKLLLSLPPNYAGVSGMIRVTFVAYDATEREIIIEPDGSLMQAAKSNSVPGIDADCGGACSCATCHVFVDHEWFGRVGAIGQWEESMLGLTPDRQPNSRLSCQIKLSETLDGLVVTTPEFQY